MRNENKMHCTDAVVLFYLKNKLENYETRIFNSKKLRNREQISLQRKALAKSIREGNF